MKKFQKNFFVFCFFSSPHVPEDKWHSQKKWIFQFSLRGYPDMCGTWNSIRSFVHPSVSPLVCNHESKSAETSNLDAFWFFACKWVTWGVNGSWMPLPTCQQQYYDLASLVFLITTWKNGNIKKYVVGS